MSKFQMDDTLHLGSELAKDFEAIKIAVQNRRMKVSQDEDGFKPSFQAKLWKLKAYGDPAKAEDWFERDMWVSKNGSLVYRSIREARDLAYYTAADLASATAE